MKSILIFLAIFAAANADTSKWLDFRLKYATLPIGIGKTSYIQVQRTQTEALSKGWVLVNTTNSLNATTLCWSEKDNRMCPIYDKRGNVAGMLLAIPVDEVEGHGVPYDFNRFKVYEKKTINGILYWTSTYYLVNPKTVASGAPTSSTGPLGSGLWLKNRDETFNYIPSDLASIQNNTDYTWQNCIPSMGIHYYFNMTPSLKCEDYDPYFLMIKNGNIVGLGWQFFGKTQYVDKDWYDSIDETAAKLTVPMAGPCLADYVTKYGVISVHMYFVEKPWLIGCTQKTDSVVPIPGLP